jgi:hypothetical protein
LNYCDTLPLPDQGTNDITAEPKLTDSMHISSDSSCRGTGNSAFAVGADIDGEPWQDPPSIGCDEFSTNATGPLFVSSTVDFPDVLVGYPAYLSGSVLGHATRSTWDFGDGTAITNELFTSHVWTNLGPVTVTLTAYNESNPGGITTSVTLQVVSQLVYYVNISNAHPNPPYRSWDTAAKDTQSAVNAVFAPGSLVLVADGSYMRPYFTPLMINTPITMRSIHGPAVTTLYSYPTYPGNQSCVSLVAGARLEGFTLTGGGADYGGGAYCASTNAVLSDCIITSCSARYLGGGAYGCILNNCVIHDCPAGDFTTGGGAYGCIISSCTLSNNSAGVGGGASSSTLVNCLVIGNSSAGYGASGGGLDHSVAIDSTLTDNRANTVGGGADASTLINCLITYNFGDFYGGGASHSTLNNCLVTGNFSGETGGGAELCTLNNSLVCSNIAWNSDGGGVQSSTLTNCTVVYNATHWGNVGGADSSTLINCIVDFNVGSNYSGSTLSYCCTTPLPASGSGNITGDPQLQSDSLHLSAASPCRGAGNAAFANGLDLDGQPWLTPPSIGCVEYYTNATIGLAIQVNYTNVVVGYPLSFQGIVTGGSPALSAWTFGDGAGDSSGLTVSHSWSLPGDYAVVLAVFFNGNPISMIATQLVHVVTNDSPTILVQPADQIVTAGNTARFAVSAGGSPLLEYQWQFNGTNIVGATNSAVTLLNVQPEQAGAYSVLIVNPLGYPPGQVVSSNALLTVNNPVCAPLSAGLVGWWQAESNMIDHVGGNNGAMMGGAGFATGKVGLAFAFDGTTGFVQVPSSPILKPTQSFTVETWINFQRFAGTNGATIAMKGPDDAVPADWALSLSPAQKLLPQLNVGGNWVSFECATILSTGVWYHVAMVYDGSSLSGFVNGLLDGSQSFSGTVRSSDSAMRIGVYAPSLSPPEAGFFNGLIDELSFYERGLAGLEIQQVYTASSAGKCDVPVGPSIMVQPQSLAVLPSTSALFSVVAGGDVPLNYQWLVNGSAVAGETNSTLTLTNVQYSQSGFLYGVLVTNSGGSLLSDNAVLTVIDTPPQLSSISNQTVSYLAPVITLLFMVWDAESPAYQLQLTGTSSNTNLVLNTNIVFGGSDTNRTVTVTPTSNHLGQALITITATDPGGLSNQTSFTLTVTNSLPQISAITNLHIPINGFTGPLPFTVSDFETPAERLVVTASSSNTNVVPPAQIVLGGTGTNRTVNITPATNLAGTATITLAVTDDVGGTNQTSFTLTVDQFTPLPTGLPALQYGAVAWGDYDNDGALDLLISGSTNGGPSGGITRVYHNDGGQFTNFISFPGLFGSAIAWGDYDRDGRLDFVVSGMTVSNTPITRIYHNNGDGTFTDINAGLVGVYFGSVAWGDYDNDGAPDLIVSGRVPISSYLDTNVCRLYHNEGNGRFLDIHASLPAPTDGTTAWGDYDNDGRLDLLLVGNLPPAAQSIGAIYRNVGGGVFTNINAGLPASATYQYQLSAAWGDYDNDGLLDVAITSGGRFASIYHNSGTNMFTLTASLPAPQFPSLLWGDFDNDGFRDLLVGDDYISHLYRNNGNGTFADTRLSLPNAGTESIAWGDVYNAGALDILFDGNASAPIYRNNNGMRNTPPGSPGSLSSTVGPTNTVVFTWSPAVDAQTRSNGLSYNLRVGTTPGGFDVVSPQADPLTGQRLLPAMGNARPTNRALLINLPAGTYYWSVQAIDTTFAGSPFAPEATFTITNARPVISPIADQTIAPATPTPFIPFTIGDVETAASNLLVSVQSSDTNVVPLSSILISGTDSNRTVQITPRTNGVSLITIHVTDEQGAFGTASFLLTATQFIPASANFVPVQNSILAWGDFNNDGRLDVLVAGKTNSNSGGIPVTQLYRNDGNGVFTPVPSGLPGVTYGSAAWGDFNNDGQLDLVLTGTTNGQATGAITRVYRNDHGALTDIGAALPALYFSSVAWGDFDNDGKLDLLLAGSTNGAASGAITRVYHNNGDGTFSMLASLTGIFQGSVACADLDGDGALDIVLSGVGQTGTGVGWVFRNNRDGTFTPITSLPGINNGSVVIGDFDGDGRPDVFVTGGYLTRLYRNLGNFTVTNLGVNIPAVAGASAAWGDVNNDGRLDLVLSGTVNGVGSGAFTRIYLNTGSLVGSLAFSNFPVNLPTNYQGTVTWIDFNQDNKLDLLLAGTDGVFLGSYRRSQTALFMNTSGISNTPPTAPGALSFVRSNTTVLLTWAPSTDAQTTNASGLNYDLRVGSTPGGVEAVSPPADIGSGLRRLVQMGAASTTQWRLLNLAPGTYYWSVQAIDTSFAGSLFAPEATFVVLSPPIAVPDAIATLTNASVTFSASKLTANDIETNGYPLTVTAVSPASIRGGAVLLSSNNVTYTPPLNFNGNDSFLYTISDGQSASAVGTVFMTVGSGGPVSLRITFGPVTDNGDFVVRYSGVPGVAYTIEATSELNGSWSKVENITAPPVDTGFGPGVFEFRVPLDGHQIRFYRVVYPAY